MAKHKIEDMPFAKVYPLYINKAERKGRTAAEVDAIIYWLTGYDATALQALLVAEVNFSDFFANAPALNPLRSLIRGVVCGVRVEEVADPLMQNIRYLDKLIDELAKGKSLERILRQNP